MEGIQKTKTAAQWLSEDKKIKRNERLSGDKDYMR